MHLCYNRRMKIAFRASTSCVLAAVFLMLYGSSCQGSHLASIHHTDTTPLLAGFACLAVIALIAARQFKERKRVQQSLAESEERYRVLSEGIREYAAIPLDAEGRVMNWNPGAERIFGYGPEEIVGRHFSLFFTDEENNRGTPSEAVHRSIADERSECESRLRHKSGEHFWGAVTLMALRNGGSAVRGFSLVVRDVTDRKRSEESLRKLMLSLDQATDLVVMTDRDGMIGYVNKATEGLLGYDRKDVIGRTANIWLSGEQDPKTTAERHEALQSGKPFEGIVTTRKKSGEVVYVYEVTTPLKDANGHITHFISTARDITQQKSMEERLNYLAYYDALTGIPNRTLFIDRLTQGIARARYGKKVIGVLIIDIDRFKFVNDVYGLDAGDRVLKSITGRLAASIRDGDSLARLGSDDFGILLFDVAEADDIILVVKKVMENVTLPIKEHGDETVVTSTIGIAVYPYDGEDAHEVMKNADIALSNAKQQGRNNYQFYTKDMNSRAMEFVSIDKQLFNSFKNHEFTIYYQPYWNTATQKLMGMEALIRWNSRTEGVVSPSRFIPVLEDTGLIIEVGEWVTRSVCRQISEWEEAGLATVPVSVNISSVQFRRQDIADTILAAVDRYSIDPKLLTLEITESTFMRNTEFARQVLTRLKKTGISMSLDDFGTGYSSLSYLQKFPFDNLKIDISFVRELTLDNHSSSIVSAIIAMARSLKLKTIAEGVETENLWKILRLLQCDMVQGNHFSPPVPAKDVEIFLQ